MDNECQLCGAPGGHPYCGPACQAADNPEEDGDSQPRPSAAPVRELRPHLHQFADSIPISNQPLGGL